MWNLPNLITLFRIILIPVLVIMYFWPGPWREVIVAGTFILAAATDWLDGYLARKLDMTSRLGAFLDPVADKLIVSSALVLLVSDFRVLSGVYDEVLFAIAVTIIIGREIAISALREWMAELGERGSVAVGSTGKIKTAMQMIAIALMLYGLPIFGLATMRIGELALYVAAALTLWSMIEYLRAAWPFLMEKN
ncbi:MAG: CDP-diacylglycerol--glycerol-3-phosphate 3-phosphatidyltransferase [Acidiferrobacterales bacterium]|nr:CDP-diacylglycerol--glycerol-3-phosphate 3-phosphatidyltransferase [Acidiferrobacterales bacterium]